MLGLFNIPRQAERWRTNGEQATEELKLVMRQALGEDVRNLKLG